MPTPGQRRKTEDVWLEAVADIRRGAIARMLEGRFAAPMFPEKPAGQAMSLASGNLAISLADVVAGAGAWFRLKGTYDHDAEAP